MRDQDGSDLQLGTALTIVSIKRIYQQMKISPHSAFQINKFLRKLFYKKKKGGGDFLSLELPSCHYGRSLSFSLKISSGLAKGALSCHYSSTPLSLSLKLIVLCKLKEKKLVYLPLGHRRQEFISTDSSFLWHWHPMWIPICVQLLHF